MAQFKKFNTQKFLRPSSVNAIHQTINNNKIGQEFCASNNLQLFTVIKVKTKIFK